MSLLTNYEGLRHQIERLVRENEELKKLVRLLRENHELKSAIKTQAGGLGISGFPGGLGEVATMPSQRQGVFLSSSPAAAHKPILEELGIVALAPLADMLTSPQPSLAADPISSPLTGPVNTLLPSPGPLSQNSLLASLLTSPMAVPTAGTLASSLGLPSTGALAPSSPLGISQSSPLMVPVTGTMAVSLSSPLLTSTAAPLGISQNLLANPTSKLVLSEAQRLRLAQTQPGGLSEPHTSAGMGPPATSKVPLATEPTQDPEVISVTFVGVPTQASTPVGTAGPTTTFSCGTSNAHTEPAAPQGQAAASVTSLPSAPTPAPPSATSYTSSSTPHVAQGSPHPPTRPALTPHAPPRTSSSPASVNDTRDPRGPEPSRKSIPDLDLKLSHRKASKFPECPREPQQLARERLVGEIAFQLDRRILSSVFPERVRLYGFTVSNIPEKIIQTSLNPSSHKLDEALCQALTQRYVSVMNRLQGLGYSGRLHPALTEQLVNAYGILRERPELAASEGASYTVEFLQRVLLETVHPSMLTDALLLLSCLSQLAQDDGKPMFIW